MFIVETHAYCGMVLPHGEYYTLEEARGRVARRLRWARRQGSRFYAIGEHEWEIEEPEDCLMVPDFCGILAIKEQEEEDLLELSEGYA